MSEMSSASSSSSEPSASSQSQPSAPPSPPRPPSGTVTFLFTDIEGSTKRWEKHPQEMAVAVARHDEIMRAAITAHHGHVFKTVGDAFCAVFPTAVDAAAAALAAQQALAAERWVDAIAPIRVRMGLHTGEADERDADYFGPPVNRVARLMSAGHGGQVLVSDVTDDHVRTQMPEGAQLRSLGRHRLKDLSRPEHIYQLVGAGLPAEFPRLKTQPSPYGGLLAAVVAILVALASFRFGTRSSSEEVTLALFSPLSLFTGFKGLVLELSTLNEYVLLGAGGLFTALATVVGIGRWRTVRKERALQVVEPGRWAGALVNQRSVAFLGAMGLTVLGAFAYQQYLWNVALPVPDDALGIALTREAAAATVTDELADALYSQGQAEQVVVRQLPVRFDARDTAKARAMGERIGARAVLIYRADEDAAAGQPKYVAYVVFTDPSIGLTIGGDPAASAPGAAPAQSGLPVQVKEGVPVPVLRTETLDELVNAAAGVIAYDDDRAREAISHLELARPASADAPNTGIVNFYLGNAYNLDEQLQPAAAAYEQAAAFYEGRQQAGEILGPQDSLILVKTYLELGNVASFSEDWEGALAWYERGLDPREDVLARASGLERPTDVHATYARLYTLMADAYRFLGRAEDQRVWEERARDEIAALVELSDPTDPTALTQRSSASFFIGDCRGAGETLLQAAALNADHARPLTNAGIVALSQGRTDLAEEYWRQVIRDHPDDIEARKLVALLLLLKGIGGPSFEPAYLLEAEEMYREIIAIDPTNLEAHQEIADLADLRATGKVFDWNALNKDDGLTLAKSQILWPVDPARRQAAIDIYAIVIEQRRIVASELQRGNPTAEVAVAEAYLEPVLLNYSVLLNMAVAGQQDQVDALSPELGPQIVADASQVREWTDRVLANPDATRLDRLRAWSARTQSLEREWSWYRFFAEDTEKAEALEAEFRQGVADALAFGEAEPIGGIDEIAPLRIVYFEAQTLEFIVDGDDAAGEAYTAKIQELTAQEQTQRSEGISHYTTFCTEVREQEAGDALLAQGDASGAQRHFETALKANPEHIDALLGLATARADQGDFKGAVIQARSAAEAAPERVELWGVLARYQLAAGDAGHEATLDRFLSLAAELPTEERMATVGDVIAELDAMVTEQPELAPAVRATIPRLSGFLDEKAADGKGTYQYPVLHSALGRLALDLDEPARAEPLLRRAIELDPHQPVAHADLILAVLVQGRDATAEMDAAFTEAADPVWASVPEYDSERVLTLMEEEAKRYAERVPNRAAAVAPFTEALPAGRERVDLQRRGVVGTTYTSPTFDFGLRWEEGWSVTDASSENGADAIEISNGLSSVSLRSYATEATDSTGCRDELVNTMTTSGAWGKLTPATGTDGGPVSVDGATRASTALIEQPEGGPAAVYVIECRALPGEAGFVIVLAIVSAQLYEQQAAPVNQVLATVELGVPQNDTAATPVATPVAAEAPLTLPALDLSEFVAEMPGVVGDVYTSPSFGFSLPVPAPWVVEASTSAEGADLLQLTDGSSQVFLDAYTAPDVTPTACVGEVATDLRSDDTFADVAIMTGADGQPLRSGDVTGATTAFTYTRVDVEGASGAPEVLYVACRPLANGGMLRVLHFGTPEVYDAQAQAREKLLAGLELGEAPAADRPQPGQPPRR